MPARKTVLYIACSLDGYIAGENDNLDFLDAVQTEGEDYGYSDFYKQTDTVIMGRRTYAKVLGFGIPYPHAGKTSYIMTRQSFPAEAGIVFCDTPLKNLITELKKENGGHIFIDGGSELLHGLLQESLVDELIISIIPVLLGKGIPLFKPGRPAEKLELISSKAFASGLVQVHYRRIAE